MTLPFRWPAWTVQALARSGIGPGSRWRAAVSRNRARLHFDDRYYGDTYADVAHPAFDRFRHFMEDGWREGRNPSAAFDTLYYRDVHLGGACRNPLLHFVEEGDALGLTTRAGDAEALHLAIQHALCAGYFEEEAYRRASGYAGEDALLHYLREGWREKIAPSDLFDPIDYVDRHRFLAKHEVSPLYHLASQRRSAGEAVPVSLDLFAVAPPETLMYRERAPTRDLVPPRLLELQPVPPALRTQLTAIWRSGRTGGEAISTYRFKDVFVTGEGLVFTDRAGVIDVARIGYPDHSIRDGALAIATARLRGDYETIESGILTETRGAQNYGHFILEMLPRAWFARTHLGCRQPAIIRGKGSPIEQVCREALACSGFGPDAIVAVGDAPVFVRDLVVVEGLARHPLYISPTVLRCFEEIARRVEAGPVAKIYAARGAGCLRDFADEPAVAARLASAGFQRIETGGMSFEAQVALFKGATHVLGVGGAALTNLLFCRPGTRVTVMSPASASEVLFWMIAELRGLDYEEVRCREVGPHQGGLSWNRAIEVTPAELARLLG